MRKEFLHWYTYIVCQGPGLRLSWPALVTLLVLVAAGAQADVLSNTVRKIKPSIVGVGTYQETRRPPAQLRGTGFVVGDGHHVITNAHVLPGTTNREKHEQLAVFVGRGSKAKVIRAERVAEDKDYDLAVLKVGGPSLPVLVLGDSKKVVEGQSIAFTGFPIGSVLGLYPVTHRGIVSAITPIVIPASSARQLNPKLIRRMREPYTVFQLDATAYPGNSGSPVYEPSTGKVVGVVNKVFVKGTKESVLEKPSGITYAIPSRYAKRLLKRAGVKERAKR